MYLINGKKVTVTVDTSDRCDQVLEVSKPANSRGFTMRLIISFLVSRSHKLISQVVHFAM